MKEFLKRHLPFWLQHRFRLFKYRNIREKHSPLSTAISLSDDKKAMIDVGANWGVFTWIMSKRAPYVIAVEPHPVCIRYLKKILPLNVKLYEEALSSHSGQVELRTPAEDNEDTGRSTIEIKNELSDFDSQNVISRAVSVKPLDALVETDKRLLELGIGFIKIDVEGHEFDVLKGMSGILKKDFPVLLVEIEKRHGAVIHELFEYMTNLGYVGAYLKTGRSELYSVNAQELEDAQESRLKSSDSPPNDVIFLPPRHQAIAKLSHNFS